MQALTSNSDDEIRSCLAMLRAIRRVVMNATGAVCAYFGTPEGLIAEVQQAGFVVLNSEVMVSPDGDMIHIEARKRDKQDAAGIPLKSEPT